MRELVHNRIEKVAVGAFDSTNEVEGEPVRLPVLVAGGVATEVALRPVADRLHNFQRSAFLCDFLG